VNTRPTTTDPTWEIVNGDQHLSDQAIESLANLLIAIDDEVMENEKT
jgi:hypothetical protein